MTTSFEAQATATTAVAEEQTTITQLAGFICEPKVQTQSTCPLFVSLDAHRASGSCVYTLDAEQRRVYLPSQFVASLHKVEVVERDYGGDYASYSKVIFTLTIGGKLYSLFAGLNSWAGQSLLQSLGQLTEQELSSTLLFKAVAGRRTVFFRLSLEIDGEWASVSINENMLSNRLEAEELTLLANTIDETLGSAN